MQGGWGNCRAGEELKREEQGGQTGRVVRGELTETPGRGTKQYLLGFTPWKPLIGYY